MVAGYGVIIRNCTESKTTKLSGCLPAGPEVSNIRAEMVAVAEALESLPDNSTVTIWVPSAFMPKAIRHGFKRNANLDVWERLEKQLARHVIKRFRHEQLYFNKPEMAEAQALATQEARKELTNA